MSGFAHSHQPSRSSVKLLLPLLAVWLCLSGNALGQDNPIVRVEEDWELVIATPDINSNAPQIVTALSPGENLRSLHVTFEINHRSSPDGIAGGLHLQVWRGEQLLATNSYPDTDTMATAGETVRWTQTMSLQNGQIIFEIIRGQSSTWGTFGGQGNLKATLSSSLVSLDNYSPEVSAKQSGVAFAAHCVRSLTLNSVRVVRADGTAISVVLDRPIAEQQGVPGE